PVAEPDRAVLETRGDQAAIASKRRTGGRRSGSQDRGERLSGRGVAKLDRAVPSQCEECTTVRTKPAGRLVMDHPPDRLRPDGVPQPAGVPGFREEGATIRPELDSPHDASAGQQFAEGPAGRGIPESSAGLAGMIAGQTHREYLAVRAVGQAEDDF